MFKVTVLTVILIIFVCTIVEAKLKLINVVFRHGDRAPDNNGEELYPNDPYRHSSFYPEHLGGLSNSGKLREYRLGRYLKKHYGSFLGDIYLPEKVFARSTNKDRTKMSLQLVLAALFPPKREQKWKFNLIWQPIPTNYISFLDDKLMLPEQCPKYLLAREKVEALPEVKAELNKFEGMMSYLTEVTGKNISNSNDMYYLYHTLRAEQSLGLKIPTHFSGLFPDGWLRDGTLLEYKIASYNTEMKRLNGGMLLRKFLQNMVDSIHKRMDPERKIFLYSGHETDVAALLQTLGVFEPAHVPEYSSAVIIELHEEDDEYFVKVVYYKGIVKHGPIAEVKAIRGCETMCPLRTFRSLLRKVTASDEDVKCDKRSFRERLEQNKIKIPKGIIKQILNLIYEEDENRGTLMI